MSLDGIDFDERLGPILDELLHESRLGKQPDLGEYQRRFPDLAEKILELYETIFLIESNGRAEDKHSSFHSNGRKPKLKQLGEYRIVREIGRGGMGIVYEAIQESLERQVAVKVLPHSQVLSEDQIKRFEREAKAAGQLRHPNIVGVIDVGEENGIHFYVMQFIKGISLDRLLNQIRSASTQPSRFPNELPLKLSGLTTPSAAPDQSEQISIDDRPSTTSLSSQYDSKARYFRTVAKLGSCTALALDYAHRNGVLHRDIKPSNLLMDENDDVWITDFGLAKYGDDELTQTGDLVGTLRFMPPERLRGWSDPRSDVYSLGLTLYELATLTPAFGSEDRVELLRKIESEVPILPSKIIPEIPTDLETILLTSIAKEPQQRYQSAAQMAEDLQRFLSGRPILARRSTILKRLWLWSRRKPMVASLIALTLTLLSVVAGISTLSLVSLNKRFMEVSAANQTADERLLDAYLTQIHASRSSNVLGSRKSAMDAIRNAKPLVDELRPEELFRLRTQAIAVLSKPDILVGKEWPIEQIGNDRPDAAFDDSIGHMVRINKDGHIEFVDLETGDRNPLVSLPSFSRVCSQVSLSPDGSIAIVGGQLNSGGFSLLVIDRKSGKVLLERKRAQADYLEQSCFSSDGSRFAFTEETRLPEPITSIVIGCRNDRFDLTQIVATDGWSFVNFSHDGKFIIHCYKKEIRVTNITTKETVASLHSDKTIQCGGFGPGDRTIILSPIRGPVEFWQFQKNKLESLNREMPLGSPQKQIHITSHPRLPLVITTGVDGRSTLWNSNSGEQTVVTDFRCIKIASNGQRIGFSNQENSFGYLNIVTPQSVKEIHLPPKKRIIVSVDFCENEKNLIVVDSNTNSMSLIDVETAAITSRVDTEKPNREFARFLPGTSERILDGKQFGKSSLNIYKIQESKDRIGSDISIVLEKSGWKDLTPDSQAFGFDAAKRRFCIISKQKFLEWRSWPEAELLGKAKLPDLNFKYLDVSPDGRFVSVSRNNYVQVCVYDFQTKEITFQPKLETRDFRYRQNTGCLTSFSKNGKLFAVATPTDFRFFSTGDWSLVKVIPREKIGVGHVAFSENFIATADYDCINLYSAANLELIARLETAVPIQFSSDYSDEIPGLIFSPSGKYLAAGTMRNRVVLWDLIELRKELSELGLNWE